MMKYSTFPNLPYFTVLKIKGKRRLPNKRSNVFRCDVFGLILEARQEPGVIYSCFQLYYKMYKMDRVLAAEGYRSYTMVGSSSPARKAEGKSTKLCNF